MRSLVLGTAGHVDHGKTVLVEALTGVNTDRWEEERQRGITIDLGFAPLATTDPELEISIVDVPGHEDFVKNMLAGATGVDVLLLVVAADEGPMPQTREHLWIARLLGIRYGVAALSKADLADPDLLELGAEAVRDELQTVYGSADWPVVPVSGRTGSGLDDLRRAILQAARSCTRRRQDDLFRLPVDRSFTLHGVGTVVTGTVWGGQIDVGAELWILPGRRTARLRGIQVHGTDVDRAVAGQRAALALSGVGREEVSRGDWITNRGSALRGTTCLEAQVRLLPNSRWPLETWQRVRVYSGTREVLGRVVHFEAERLDPGGEGVVQFRLEEPLVARAGDPYVLRFYSPVTTIGGGVVLNPWARPRRRWLPGERDALQAVTEPDPLGRLTGSLSRVGGRALPELAVLLGVPEPDLRSALETLVEAARAREIEGRWYDVAALEEARAGVVRALRAAHERAPDSAGLDLQALRRGLDVPVELVNTAVADLEEQGTVRVNGSVAALAGHRPRLGTEQRALAEAAWKAIRTGGLQPPRLAELAARLEVTEESLRHVLRFLVERGRLQAITPDLYLEPEALSELRDRVRRFLEPGRSATPADFRDIIDVSRKYLIPLLEYLDATGLTRRTPAGRVLREAS